MFRAIPNLNKMHMQEIARCAWTERRENVIALGPSGTGKNYVALGLGLAAWRIFMALGLGFLFIEIAFIQRFILFLGHLLYAVAVVLAGFLVFAGDVGAVLGQRSARGKQRIPLCDHSPLIMC